MKFPTLTLALLVPLCFGTNLRNLQDDLIFNNLFFSQCSCNDDEVLVRDQVVQAIFPQAFPIVGIDEYSCPAEVNEFSGLPTSAGTVFNVDSTAGSSAFSATVANAFFRNADGTRGDFFVAFAFGVPPGIDERVTFTLIEVPDENIFLRVTFDPTVEENNVIFSSHFGNDLDSTIDLTQTNDFTVLFAEQEGLGFPVIPVLEVKISSDNLQAELSLSIPGTIPDVPVAVLLEGVTQVDIFSNAANEGVPFTVLPRFAHFGRNLLSFGEVNDINSVNDFFSAIDDKFPQFEIEPPLMPNVVNDQVVAFNKGLVNEFKITDLFEVDVEGLSFAFNDDNLNGQIFVSEVTGDFNYVSEENFVGSDSFIVNVRRLDIDCDFDLTVTIDVQENPNPPEEADNTGVIIGVTVVGIFAVIAVVGGVVFVKNRSSKDTEEEIKKAEEVEENKEGAATVVPETDI